MLDFSIYSLAKQCLNPFEPRGLVTVIIRTSVQHLEILIG